MADEYADAELQRILAEDAHIAELGIEVIPRGDYVVLRGQVATEERRAAIEQRAVTQMPQCRVVNEIVVLPADPPPRMEQLP
ncbi:MAG: BON domain-containing protein [Micromonosporaceae bacterium]